MELIIGFVSCLIWEAPVNIRLLSMWEHVAKWIGYWTQDYKVWGSILTAGHV